MATAGMRSLYRRWLDRRMPAARQQQLTQRRIFILPTGYGVFFMVIAGSLFLGGINYENNLIMALSFLMTSLFMIAILHTFRNLSGLVLRAGRMAPGFAGTDGALELVLHAGDQQAHTGLWLAYPGAAPEEVSVSPGEEKNVWLSVPLRRRGYNRAGRVRIESRYPLGLLRAWSLLDMDQACLGWPRPLASEECPAGGGEQLQGQYAGRQRGSDDFQGLRSYQEGDSPRQVDWKAYAAGRGLHSKHFADPAEGWLWLDWSLLPAMDTETRLGRLAWWVLALEQRQQRYGLRLPGTELPPALGADQRRRALDMLGLYGENIQGGEH
ncbi:DUF58 domain-containing protein [Alcanivorax sp. JB21]|uniref:DUF58 domain-containing protein n=1 Tax=Alcanivorax limicola TaxID=2874102 RepID=UPI001CBD1F7C|nr:DUF58 domain-containing protein [Alcanivorax limicola]MBZ2187683.1 DUF58 domain-containing protein [Alcanivorax limicola]